MLVSLGPGGDEQCGLQAYNGGLVFLVTSCHLETLRKSHCIRIKDTPVTQEILRVLGGPVSGTRVRPNWPKGAPSATVTKEMSRVLGAL